MIRLYLFGGPADGRVLTLTRSRPPVRFITLGGSVYAPGQKRDDDHSWTYTYLGERNELDADPA